MSRAEYYREYRKRTKKEASEETSFEQFADVHETLDGVAQQLRDVAQQLQQTNDMLRNMLQIVAQQNSQQMQHHAEVVSLITSNGLGQVESGDVAQQPATNVAQHVAQQGGAKSKVKRKGILPPFSPLLSPPHTPPYSSPLISPHLPKEKEIQGPENFSSGQAGDVAQQSPTILPESGQPDQTSPDLQAEVGSGLPSQSVRQIPPDPLADVVDDPAATLVDVGRAKGRDIATWAELDAATALIFDETRSHRLVDAFYNWIEYKQERGPKEFYTKRGLVSEAKRFITRHLNEMDVPSAVERAIASDWQGWDHDLKK